VRKKRAIRRLVRGLGERHALLAEDETDLLLFPPVRAGWALRGRPAEVPLSGRNARRVVFGALNLRTGYRLLLDREHQRAGDFQAFLRLVRGHYRGWHVVLLLDEDPSHTAAGSQRLADELGVRLVWLPKRCPELNPMDHLWGHAKEAMCGNRQDATIEQTVERFLDYLDGLSRDGLSRWEALTKAGTLSGDFWLRV
jgi:transposase